MREWLCYNFAAGSFHTQKNFVAGFIRLKLTFTQETKKSLFEPSFLDLGVMYALRL